ncbi:MAG TPA: Ig-like domain-containing protein, partial [Clostridia bacterium]|nr:Ig-like domain-containing protein [Clostridia bacterium]
YLSGVPVVTNGNNLLATREPCDPYLEMNGGFATVWWSWIAPSNGLYAEAAFMTNAGQPLVMAFTGSACSGLTPVVYMQQQPSQVVRAGITCNAYQVTFNATAGTEYQIMADARDLHQGPFDLVISVAPSIGFSSPTSGTDFTPGSDIPLSASASAPCGTVESVQYSLRFGAGIGVATNAPWTLVWSNVSVGRYELVAQATDDLGITATTDPLVITAGRPSNDDFADRIVLTGLPALGSAPLRAAGKEPGEEVAIGGSTTCNTVWWSWTAPSNGQYAVVASVTNRAATVGVYTGTSVSGLALWAYGTFGHTASMNGQKRLISQANWQAVGGTTYQIVVNGGASGINDNAGPYDVALAITLPPEGIFSSPTNGSVFSDGANVLLSADVEDLDGFIQQVDFYQVISGPNWGSMNLLGSAFQYPWRTVSSAMPTGCYPLCASITDNLGAQTRLTKWVWVGVSRPANDDFAAATPIPNTHTNTTISGSNYWATSEPGEPYPAMKTVWWRWTAPASGQVSLTTTGSSFLVCTGSSISTMFPLVIASQGAVVQFKVEAGTTYHISLGETGYGNFMLNMSTPPAPAVQLVILPQFSEGTPRFRFSGVSGQTSVLEGSIDLRSWVGLATNINVAGPMEIVDPSVPGMPRRFYRLRQE